MIFMVRLEMLLKQLKAFLVKMFWNKFLVKMHVNHRKALQVLLELKNIFSKSIFSYSKTLSNKTLITDAVSYCING